MLYASCTYHVPPIHLSLVTSLPGFPSSFQFYIVMCFKVFKGEILICFLLLMSLCLHVLSMYVWFCPHHDNPSLPAEGKQRRSFNAGPPVALPLASFPFSQLCVCVCICLLHGEHQRHSGRRKGDSDRDKGRRVFLCFHSDAESVQHVEPLLSRLMTLAREAAWQEEDLNITQHPPHITSQLYGT